MAFKCTAGEGAGTWAIHSMGPIGLQLPGQVGLCKADPDPQIQEQVNQEELCRLTSLTSEESGLIGTKRNDHQAWNVITGMSSDCEEPVQGKELVSRNACAIGAFSLTSIVTDPYVFPRYHVRNPKIFLDKACLPEKNQTSPKFAGDTSSKLELKSTSTSAACNREHEDGYFIFHVSTEFGSCKLRTEDWLSFIKSIDQLGFSYCASHKDWKNISVESLQTKKQLIQNLLYARERNQLKTVLIKAVRDISCRDVLGCLWNSVSKGTAADCEIGKMRDFGCFGGQPGGCWALGSRGFPDEKWSSCRNFQGSVRRSAFAVGTGNDAVRLVGCNSSANLATLMLTKVSATLSGCRSSHWQKYEFNRYMDLTDNYSILFPPHLQLLVTIQHLKLSAKSLVTGHNSI
ncbi:hypothetical protein Anapl_09093 [Anas platyrhynchos]|uniref:Uncharacterized protein n=1 Tax=Anas platyrhynchos TaxID=8839 RepID=R0L2V7_ANAPL|nr:hypothetical protein Anapl_09093 [Anas platyrhynchos]